MVLVEPEARTSVTAGENAGRELRHINVVRALESRELTPPALTRYEGRIVIGVDERVEQDLFAVGLLHHATTLEIVAAGVERPQHRKPGSER